MQQEIKSIADNNVWNLVKLPNDQTPINCKWVFKKKIAPNGTLSSYKLDLLLEVSHRNIVLITKKHLHLLLDLNLLEHYCL